MKAEEKFKYLRKLAAEPEEVLTWPTNHQQIEARELLAFWDAQHENTSAVDRNTICEIGRIFWGENKQCYSAEAVLRKVKDEFWRAHMKGPQ